MEQCVHRLMAGQIHTSEGITHEVIVDLACSSGHRQGAMTQRWYPRVAA